MQRRWKCPHCATEGWGEYGPHDRTDGKSCRPSGQITDAEAAAKLQAVLNRDGARWIVRGVRA